MAKKKTATTSANISTPAASAVIGGNGHSLDASLLLTTLTAFRKGDFAARMPLDRTGVEGKICDTLNEIIELEERKSKELDRVSTVVGREGKLKERVTMGVLPGAWGGTVASVNTLIDGLVQPTTEVVRVVRAVATGDLNQTISLETDIGPLQGEFLATARAINTSCRRPGVIGCALAWWFSDSCALKCRHHLFCDQRLCYCW